MADVEPLLEQAGHGRNFARGREAFTAAQCIPVPPHGQPGRVVGSELTAISSRYNRHDVLESILLPSKVVSEQYQNMTFTKKNGDEVTGRIAEEDDRKVAVMTNPQTDARARNP